MVISVVNDKQEKVSYLRLIMDVFFIFILGLFLLVLFRTFTKNKMYFTIALSIYIIIFSVYTLLYLNMITNPNLIYGIHHRLINFINIYNIFLSVFMIIISVFYVSYDYDYKR
jgi:hypothetical protein